MGAPRNGARQLRLCLLVGAGWDELAGGLRLNWLVLAGASREHVELDLRGGLIGGLALLLCAQGLGHLHALERVVGGGEHLVGELADVLEQALALLPEQAGVDHDLLGVLVGLATDDLRLALGALDPALGLSARAGGDLVGGLVGALEDAGRLLTDLVEGSLHDGLAALATLKLAQQRDHLLHELVHRMTLVAP